MSENRFDLSEYINTEEDVTKYAKLLGDIKKYSNGEAIEGMDITGSMMISN